MKQHDSSMGGAAQDPFNSVTEWVGGTSNGTGAKVGITTPAAPSIDAHATEPRIPSARPEDYARITNAWAVAVQLLESLEEIESVIQSTSVKVRVHAALDHLYDAVHEIRLAHSLERNGR